MKNLIVALTVTITSSLALANAAIENRQALCIVKSTVGDAQVVIDLHEDYRYLVGSKNFELGEANSSIEIVTWSGARAQVSQNTFNINGLTLNNADMKASVSTGSFSYSVDCHLK